MAANETKFQMLFEAAPDAIIIVDSAGKINAINHKAEQYFGYAPKELLGQYIEILVPTPLQATHVIQRLEYMRCPASRPMGAGINLSAKRKDGSTFPVDISLSPFEDKDELMIVAIIRDITARRALEEKLEHLIGHDPLTGLVNRVLFEDRIAVEIARMARLKRHLCLCLIDLDGFKQTNDTHGHAVGDLVLQAVASRLQKTIRKTDSITRLGGDEFLLLFSDIKNKEAMIKIAENILSLFKSPFKISDHQVFISISMGIAVYRVMLESGVWKNKLGGVSC